MAVGRSWPMPDQYQAALQNPDLCFADQELRSGVVEIGKLQVPRLVSGAFACVCRLKDTVGEQHAVRLFVKDPPGGPQLRAVSTFLREHPEPCFVDFEYSEDGIQVNGSWYPLVRMRWIEGRLLGRYVEDCIRNNSPAALADLRAQWRAVLTTLYGLGIAHGDLQHGNVIVAPDGTLRLIDYDGMFVPDLAGLRSVVLGVPAYQHPQRRAEDFDEDIDIFSGLLILTALRALELDGSLWDRYNDGENLLFTASDLRAPQASSLFRDLMALPDVQLTEWVTALASWCTAPMHLPVPGNVAGLYDALCGTPAAKLVLPPVVVPEQLPEPPPRWSPVSPALLPITPPSPLSMSHGYAPVSQNAGATTIAAHSMPATTATGGGSAAMTAPIIPPLSGSSPPGNADPANTGQSPGNTPSPPAPLRAGRKTQPRLPSYTTALAIMAVFILLTFTGGNLGLSGAWAEIGTSFFGIFTRASPEARFILLVAVGPFAILTLLNLVLEARRLKQECRSLAKCREGLVNLGSAPQESHLRDWTAQADPEGALCRAVEAVWNCREMQSPDLESVASVASQVEATRSNSGRTAANRILLLSLLGTVIGLSGVVSSLQPQVEQTLATGDAQALMRGLSGTLNKMGTAFASTAWGILLAGAVAWASSYVAYFRSRYLADVQHFAVAELAPQVLPQNNETQVTRLRTVTEEAFKAIQSQVQTLNDAVTAGQSLLTATNSSVTAAAKDLHDALYASSHAIIKGAGALKEVTTGFDQAVRNAEEKYVTAAANLGSAAKSVGTHMSSLNTTVNTLTTALGTQNTNLENIVQEQRNTLAQQRQEAATLVSQAKANAETIRKQIETDSQAMIAAVNQHAVAAVTTQKTGVTQFAAEMEKVLTSVRELLQKTSPTLPSPADWKAIHTALADCARALDQYQRAFGQVATNHAGAGRQAAGSSAISSGEAQKILDALQALPDAIARKLPPPVVSDPGAASRAGSVSVEANAIGAAVAAHVGPLLRQNAGPSPAAGANGMDTAALASSLEHLSRQIYALHQALAPLQDTAHAPEEPGKTRRWFGRR